MQEDVRSAVPRMDHQEEDALTFQEEDGSKSDLQQEEDGRAVADRSPKTKSPLTPCRILRRTRVPEAPALPLLRARRGTGRGNQNAADLWFTREWLCKRVILKGWRT